MYTPEYMSTCTYVQTYAYTCAHTHLTLLGLDRIHDALCDARPSKGRSRRAPSATGHAVMIDADASVSITVTAIVAVVVVLITILRLLRIAIAISIVTVMTMTIVIVLVQVIVIVGLLAV